MIIKIGRAAGNDIVIENKTVSREHATLTITDGRIVVTDLNSSSGTYLLRDDKLHRVSYHEVSDTDTILFGNERCRVRDLLERAKPQGREVVYERNPLTGEIIRR